MEISIGELSRRTGVKVPTIRYYESVALMPAPFRSGGKQRRYGEVVRESEDLFGTSIFLKDDNGAIFHTYSTHRRGAEMLMGALNWLDLVPKGRNESAGTMSPIRNTVS